MGAVSQLSCVSSGSKSQAEEGPAQLKSKRQGKVPAEQGGDGAPELHRESWPGASVFRALREILKKDLNRIVMTFPGESFEGLRVY